MIPGLQILAFISLAVAVTFLVTAFLAQWRISIIATALMVVSSLVVGGLYPWIVQTFIVVPNERTLEAPYLQKNIESTRTAFGIVATLSVQITEELQEISSPPWMQSQCPYVSLDPRHQTAISLLDTSLMAPHTIRTV